MRTIMSLDQHNPPLEDHIRLIHLHIKSDHQSAHSNSTSLETAVKKSHALIAVSTFNSYFSASILPILNSINFLISFFEFYHEKLSN